MSLIAITLKRPSLEGTTPFET